MCSHHAQSPRQRAGGTKPRVHGEGTSENVNAIKFRYKRKIIVAMWTLWFAYVSFNSEVSPASAAPYSTSDKLQKLANLQSELGDREPYTSLLRGALDGYRAPQRQLLTSSDGAVRDGEILMDAAGLLPGFNCTYPAIQDFPPDLFTQEQRQSGAVAVHFLASIYIFYMIALVCDDYFVPSIECIVESTKIPSDIAGASFMAVATSAPELFTNIIGTFITEGDIGVGTIVGSAVFNILAVCACCGFAAKTALPLDWYPLTRDCVVYLVSIILLVTILENRRVYWYEAMIFLIAYLFYILIMWKNSTLKRASETFVTYVAKTCGCTSVSDFPSQEEKTPLLGGGKDHIMETEITDTSVTPKGAGDSGRYDDMEPAKTWNSSSDDEKEDSYEVFQLPHGEGWWGWTEWIIGWPVRFVLTITIPDCRRQRLRRFYPLTFIMCIVYIALSTYVVSWMMTVIGHTFRIPDSVMGLTFIAAGTSVPEAVSSIIVARQGLGSMSISNSIGSNTFDILVCLGLPWLVRGIMIAGDEENFVQINSNSLEYSVLMLLVSLFLFYMVLALNKFYLDKKVATAATVLYAIFLVFASLFELNVFFDVNDPTCDIKT